MQARNWWTKSTALKIGGLIYVASGLLALPRSLFGGILSASLDPETGELVEEEDKENGTVYDVNTQCWDEVPSVFFTYYTIFRIVFLYLIPSAMIAVFYGKIAQHLQKTTLNESLSNDKVIQTRRKVIRMLLAMISAFVLCWLPVYILSVLELLPEGRKYLAESTWMACYLFFCVVAVYFSCISNPILYTFMSSQYRTAFHRMLRCGRLGRQHNRDQKKTTSDTDSGSLSKSTKSEVVSSGNTFWTMRKSTNLIRSDWQVGNRCHVVIEHMVDIYGITTEIKSMTTIWYSKHLYRIQIGLE